jgi:hypothetical protein
MSRNYQGSGRFSPIASAVTSVYFKPAPVLKITTLSEDFKNPLAIN